MGQSPLPDAMRQPATNSVPPAWAVHARSIWWRGDGAPGAHSGCEARNDAGRMHADSLNGKAHW